MSLSSACSLAFGDSYPAAGGRLCRCAGSYLTLRQCHPPA
nr:MAG TPA: ribosomal protein L2 [Caudoviricetes sp.]